MSSICAIWKQGRQTPASALLAGMLQAQVIYGPEREFATTADTPTGSIALGGNRMTLLPEDRFDQQPLWSADRSVCLVADVRLDNRKDLARELGLTQPETLADSDMLLAAWMRWGEGCLDRILGGFAFAVWTPARQELFAARDHIGERPLFYHRGEDLFALATVPKGLLAIPGVFQGFDQERLAAALVVAKPEWGASFFKGVRALPIGSYLRVSPDRFECKSYWHPLNAKPIRFKRDDDYPEALLEIFDKAVAARLRSPRGIGSQLSSGLDSSSVSASAARQLALRGERLTSFTSVPRREFGGEGLPGRLVYEAPGAVDVAAMYPNVDHVLVDTEGGDLVADMKRWTDVMDEPAQNGVNLLWISTILQQARDRGLGVMLQGVYGNGTISFESGAPFSKYFRTGQWWRLFRTAQSIRAHGDLSYKGALVHATNGLLPLWAKRLLIPAMSDFNMDFSPANAGFIERHGLVQKTFGRLYNDAPSLREDRAQLYERFDFGTLNAAARAIAGVDPRDPTGDKRVFEFCFSIPVEQYVVGGNTRALVRRAMKGRLPEATLARYQRGQQGADWALTVAEALPAMQAELPKIAESPTANAVLDLPRLHRLVETWPETGHGSNATTVSWNYALTRGISVGYFLRTHEVGAQYTASVEKPSATSPPMTLTPSASSQVCDTSEPSIRPAP